MTFDKRQTNIAKGVAVLLLLWHHLFSTSSVHNEFQSLFYFKGEAVESFLASFCKVCVAIFLILSGYGLDKSYNKFFAANNAGGKLPVKKQFVFVKNRLLKLMLGYWFIYILFVPFGCFFGRGFFEVYGGGILRGICNFVIDFLGLANLFGTPSMNATWWYMSIIIVYYAVFPLLKKLQSFSPELLLIISLVLLCCPNNLRQNTLWLFPFVLGMYISNYNLFDRTAKKLNTMSRAVPICLMAVLFTAYVRYNFAASENRTKFDGIFALAIIMTSFTVCQKIPLLSDILYKLGGVQRSDIYVPYIYQNLLL